MRSGLRTRWSTGRAPSLAALRPWLLRGAGLAISLVAIWLVARSVDLDATLATLRSTDPLPLVGVVGVVALQVTLRSIRWRSLLPRRPDGHTVPLASVVPALLIGYLGNAVLPARLGEPLRAYVIARREDLDAAETFGSVALERIVDLASLAAIAWLAAVGVGAPAWLVNGTGVAALLGAGLIALISTGAMERLLRSLGRSRVGRMSLFRTVERFVHGAAGARRRRLVVLAAAVSIAAWLLDGVSFWLVARALGIDLLPAGALLVAAVTVLGTALPSAPGYVGTFELAAASVAAILGVPPAPALAFALVAHAMTLLPLAAGGAISVAGMSGGFRRLAASAQAAHRTAAGPAGRQSD